MVAKKRAKKKTTVARKSPKRSSTSRKNSSRRKNTSNSRKNSSDRGLLASLLRWCIILFLLFAIGIAAIYYFGSFETRGRITNYAQQTINSVRNAQWMPDFASKAFDRIYDTLPSSEGLIVDGGELGRGESPILAGIPLSSKSMRLLRNTSYVNLFSESNKQPLCVAYRVTNNRKDSNESSETPISDPRVPSLKASQLRLSQGQVIPIAPPTSLAHTYGDNGAKEAMLLTNLVPMKEAFAQSLWKAAVQEVAVNYPKRFDEIWVYAGPAYSKQPSKLSSGVPLAKAFYLIAFDLTKSGGLRAIAFWIPTDAPPDSKLSDYITSISHIETQTSIQFLPELGFDSKDVLLNWVSPTLW